MTGKKRTQTQAEKRASQQFLAAYIASKWPAFVFDVADADPAYVEAVKKAVKAFRYEDLRQPYQDAFRILRQVGSEAADRFVHRAFEELRKEFPDDPNYVFGEIVWACEPGRHVLRLLAADLSPFHDAIIVHWERNILVQCRSLVRVDTGREALWHSRRKPTVQVNGKRYVVAFTRHTIDKILERINPRKDYMAAGDTCAYLHQTVYFEPCLIRNRTTRQYDQLAVTFYADCADKPKSASTSLSLERPSTSPI